MPSPAVISSASTHHHVRFRGVGIRFPFDTLDKCGFGCGILSRDTQFTFIDF